jgi:hypothetical protein
VAQQPNGKKKKLMGFCPVALGGDSATPKDQNWSIFYFLFYFFDQVATPLAKMGVVGGQEPPPFLFFFSFQFIFLNKIIKKIRKY